MAWTDSRVEQLRKLWAEGLSGTEIALRFGTTRCAVLGKVNKLGLPKRLTTVRAAWGSGVAARSKPRFTPPPRTQAIPVALSVPMKAKGRSAEEPTNTFDASPASQLAAAYLARADAAQRRRDQYRSQVRVR